MIKTSLIALVSAALSTAVGAAPNNGGTASSFAVSSTFAVPTAAPSAVTSSFFPFPTTGTGGCDSDIICFPVDSGFYFGGVNSTDGYNGSYPTTTYDGNFTTTSSFFGNFTTFTAPTSSFFGNFTTFTASTSSFFGNATATVSASAVPTATDFSTDTYPTNSAASGYYPYPIPAPSPRLICYPRSAAITIGGGATVTVTETAFPSGTVIPSSGAFTVTSFSTTSRPVSAVPTATD